MAFWRRSRSPAHEEQTTLTTILIEDGEESVAVVGESNYQAAIRRVCGANRGEAVRFDCVAVLVSEPENRFDPNAVMVFVDGGGKVGYLSRDDALDYQPAVQTAADAGFAISCPAHVAGRGREGETTNLGVFLKLPPPKQTLDEIDSSVGAWQAKGDA
jgi:hypothetical protein